MFKNYFLAFCTSLLAIQAFANDNWKVIQMAGTGATCGEQNLASGQIFKASQCTIKTDEQTKLTVSNERDVTLTIGAKTQIQLKPDSGKKFSATILQGLTRWLFKKDKANQTKQYSVNTANAVMGIRGTELMATFNPLLGESEVICFEGTFDFTNTKLKKSKKISKNQWGGIGGRFGTYADVLTLNEPVMAHFNQISGFN